MGKYSSKRKHGNLNVLQKMCTLAHIQFSLSNPDHIENSKLHCNKMFFLNSRLFVYPLRIRMLSMITLTTVTTGFLQGEGRGGPRSPASLLCSPNERTAKSQSKIAVL